MELEFGKPFISKFKVEIKINPSINNYFNPVLIGNIFTVDVNSSQLTLAQRDQNVLKWMFCDKIYCANLIL